MLGILDKTVQRDKSDFLKAVRSLELVFYNTSSANSTLTTQSSNSLKHPAAAEEAGMTDALSRQTILLYSIGFSLAGLTALTHLILALIALVRSCRRYGDVIHGLCFHAGVIGLIEGAYVIVVHTFFQARTVQVDAEFWRLNCKAYLFARIFLPGVFLYLLVCITICFRTIKYPPRQCSESCTRLGYIVVHCIPWVICSGSLIPVIIMHKSNIDTAITEDKECELLEQWSWFAPVGALIGVPQVILLLMTCLLCAYKPYKSHRDEAGSEEDMDLHCKTGSTNHVNVNHHQSPHRQALLPKGSRQYYRETRQLEGRPMRVARTIIMALNCLEVITQIPYGTTSILQIVLRNLSARQLIPNDTINVLFWLHLAFFPIASIFLLVFVFQIRGAFETTEKAMENEMTLRQQANKKEILHTTSMLSSV